MRHVHPQIDSIVQGQDVYQLRAGRVRPYPSGTAPEVHLLVGPRGVGSELVAGFRLELVAGFVGICIRFRKNRGPVINRALAADPVLRNEPNAGNMDGETEVGFSVKKNRAGYTHAGPDGEVTKKTIQIPGGSPQPKARWYYHMTA